MHPKVQRNPRQESRAGIQDKKGRKDSKARIQDKKGIQGKNTRQERIQGKNTRQERNPTQEYKKGIQAGMQLGMQ